MREHETPHSAGSAVDKAGLDTLVRRQQDARANGEPAHYAVLDAATADDVRDRHADQVELKHSDARKAKRARERSVEVID